MRDVHTSSDGHADATFRHDALWYDGARDFTMRGSRFVREALEADEPTLVMVTADKIALLRDELGADAQRVMFADMAEVGRNPARIIPAWREFFGDVIADGKRGRGIGEPIWATRTDEELEESQRHEALLNMAFAGLPAWLVCPYDLSTLPREVLDEAHRSHPLVGDGTSWRRSHSYDPFSLLGANDPPLPEPVSPVDEMQVEPSNLEAVRRFVAQTAAGNGLEHERAADAITAVNEVTTNTVRHGGGSGTLRVWRQGGHLVFEVRDRGRISDPLVGRRRPLAADEGGFGLWLVNHLADLVQLRAYPTGVVVRMHFALSRARAEAWAQ